MTRRLFVAAWLSRSEREAAAAVIARLRETGVPVRWVAPENLHVTLRFLGDVAAARVVELEGALSLAFRGSPAFEMRLSGLGAFPPRGRTRVLWVGIERGARELAVLASLAERALLEEGFLPAIDPRPFRAHVTLGRPKGSRGFGRLRDLLEETPFEGTARLLEEVRLVESRLSPRGAVYTVVARFPLAGGRARQHGGGDR